MPPIAIPPLVIWALGVVGAAALARFVKHEWQRVNAELHPREASPDTIRRAGLIDQRENCSGGSVPAQVSNSCTASAPASSCAER